MREGITSNLVLSQKRADSVMQFMISAGRQRQPGVRAGFRRERPRGLERHAGGPGEEPARGTDGGWFGQVNQAALAGRREQPVNPASQEQTSSSRARHDPASGHATEGVL